MVPNVRFKFEWNGGTVGNNFYLDDVTIGQYTVGIENSLNDVKSVNVFPNPNNGSFTLTYNLPKEVDVKISILDVTGREFGLVLSEHQVAGNHQENINTNQVAGLGTGIYIIRLEAGGQSYVRKLVIE